MAYTPRWKIISRAVAARMRRIAVLAGIIACFAIMISGCGIIKDLMGPVEAGEVSVQTDANLAPENTGDKDTGNDGKDTGCNCKPYEVTLFCQPRREQPGTGSRTIEKVEGVLWRLCLN